MGRPHFVSLVDQIDNLLLRRDELLTESLDLNFLVLVFEYLQSFVVVEEIVNLVAVDLIHGNSHREVTLVVLPVVDASFKEILDCKVLQPLHGVCLT
jgi:hypothetical protein